MSDTIWDAPIGDTLDLHNFRPNEATELIEEFIWCCGQSRIKQATIIHGKGAGSLRELTHSVLRMSAQVKSFKTGDGTNAGNWGKTTFEMID